MQPSCSRCGNVIEAGEPVSVDFMPAEFRSGDPRTSVLGFPVTHKECPEGRARDWARRDQ